MSECWYYRLFGEEFGPVPLVELQRVVQSGLISAEDEVRRESESAWKMASRVPELRAVMNAPRALAENKPPAATDQWRCRIGGLELGPFPFEELMALAKSGQLAANDGVKHGANGSWFEASMISRLMAAISSASSNDQPERASVRFEPSRTGASALRLMDVPLSFATPDSTPRTPAPKTSTKAPPTPRPQPERVPTIARSTPAPITANTANNEVAPVVRATPLPSAVANTPPTKTVVEHVSNVLEMPPKRHVENVPHVPEGLSSDPPRMSESRNESPPRTISPASVAPRVWSPPKAQWRIPNVALLTERLRDAARESESLPKVGGVLAVLMLIWGASWLVSADDDGPKLYSATGVVTLNGKPLPNAGVIFNPKDLTSTAKLATGRTDPRGRFTLHTFPRPGAMPSDYNVAIIATEEPPQDTRRPDDFRMRPQELNPGEPPSLPQPPKLLIPEHYTKPKESRLSFAVSATARNYFEIKLTGTPP